MDTQPDHSVNARHSHLQARQETRIGCIVKPLGWRVAALLALRRFHPALALCLPLARKATSGENTRAFWDQSYRVGEWDRLRDLHEAAHYHVLAAFGSRLSPGASVLDIGCGEGIMAPVMLEAGARSYLGVDRSPEAINRARAAAPVGAQFDVGDAESLAQDERFDVIVFNEVLYYLASPTETVTRAARLLTADGVILVSMALFGFRDGLLTLRIWRDLERVTKTIDEVTLSTRNGPAWIIRVLAPASASARAAHRV